MANYQIKITKLEPNPSFDKELAKFEERNRFNNYHQGNPEYPRTDIVKDVLTVELTDEQYKKVKAEVVKVFE